MRTLTGCLNNYRCYIEAIIVNQLFQHSGLSRFERGDASNIEAWKSRVHFIKRIRLQ